MRRACSLQGALNIEFARDSGNKVVFIYLGPLITTPWIKGNEKL